MAMIQSVVSRAVISRLLQINEELGSSILNLSGGIKTNAGVADFSVGTLLSSQSAATKIASINAGQGKSLAQTAKSTLTQIIELLNDQKDLAIQATNAALTDNERAALNTEFSAITTEINRLANTTEFNNKILLNGSISGTSSLTSVTGQATENYSLLSTSDFSFSGTVAAGDLVTASTFNIVATNSTGKTAGTSTLSFVGATSGAAVTNAVITLTGGATITFGSGQTTDSTLATAFVAAAEASTNNTVRKFTYTDNGDGTVTVTAADLGTGANSTQFSLTNRGANIVANQVKFGTENIDTVGTSSVEGFSSSVGSTAGTDKSVAAGDRTLDDGLQGGFSNFVAELDTSDTQNEVTFTVEINGTTYTSQAVTLFGTGGFNGQGNTIRNGQVIVFTNTAGPTDDNGVGTDNAFSLTIGASDVTVAGGTQDAFETDLNNIASGFETQLAAGRINQSRNIVLDETNPTGSDFTVSAADGTTFEGIESFDAVGNNSGDIKFVGDVFGDDGRIGSIGSFSFDSTIDTISVTIDGEVYKADISDNTALTGGLVDGAGSYNDVTKALTVGAGTTIVFHSVDTTDGKQLRIDLSNLTDTSIDLSTSTLVTTFENDLNTLFGVSSNDTLSFQVGTSTSDTIGISFGSAKTTDIYLDDAGASKNLDISTSAGATQASDVLDNAINAVLSLVSDASAGITSFTSAITTNNIMANNFDAASSALLETDYAMESTLYAENVLKINAGMSILAQEQNRLQTILQLLKF